MGSTHMYTVGMNPADGDKHHSYRRSFLFLILPWTITPSWIIFLGTRSSVHEQRQQWSGHLHFNVRAK